MLLIETDRFPFEFLSQVAERESWRKEVHRPIYHLHKWWAKRLGSVFRGILLGCLLPQDADLEAAFYEWRCFAGVSVLDPFMGSGPTIGEAHKLGLTALGRDINPVAVRAVQAALGPMDEQRVRESFSSLAQTVGERVHALYFSRDKRGWPCEVLYYFWAMQARCPSCQRSVDLLSSWVIARNAYPKRKPEVQILCPGCSSIFPGLNTDEEVSCPGCRLLFDPRQGPASGQKATCSGCQQQFRILPAIAALGRRPDFRLYAKMVLTPEGSKEYLPATPEDLGAYHDCGELLLLEEAAGNIELPTLLLENGCNTRQAMNYGFCSWRDFFNDRQLLALGWLRAAIAKTPDVDSRRVLLTLLSGVTEFHNLFASYKGEGTGAVRHMFSHHILKPERAPVEANVWGTPKSSGSLSGLYKSRVLRALSYRDRPIEVGGAVVSPPFSGRIEAAWPADGVLAERGIYLSCGDSSSTELSSGSLDLVVTDPPFFDNVHYSELADFFFAWQEAGVESASPRSTRHASEVQDASAEKFALKLTGVFRECFRVLRDEGLLVFTYHHSRDEGWQALAKAVLDAGFVVVNSHPVKAELSIATPKSQAKEPIQLDIIIVCRKALGQLDPSTSDEAASAAEDKLRRLEKAGFTLSKNDRRIVVQGQLLTTLRTPGDVSDAALPTEEPVEDAL